MIVSPPSLHRGDEALEIVTPRMGHRWDAFGQVMLARIIEPASKQDPLRVPVEAGTPERDRCPAAKAMRPLPVWPPPGSL